MSSKDGGAAAAAPQPYSYDVQITNARTAPVRVVAHAWRVASARGEAVVDGAGLGDDERTEAASIAADGSLRFRGKLGCLDPERGCIAEGTFRVVLENGETADLSTGAFALRPDCGAARPAPKRPGLGDRPAERFGLGDRPAAPVAPGDRPPPAPRPGLLG